MRVKLVYSVDSNRIIVFIIIDPLLSVIRSKFGVAIFSSSIWSISTRISLSKFVTYQSTEGFLKFTFNNSAIMCDSQTNLIQPFSRLRTNWPLCMITSTPVPPKRTMGYIGTMLTWTQLHNIVKPKSKSQSSVPTGPKSRPSLKNPKTQFFWLGLTQ